ncbi:UDP-glycosyltransferase UGT5-like [Homarus americanus]|uniref:UDP-glycosyltransferase UGT5-like n=2 Tax=Homarus americanus TaxID=6706 RepID=UPI001C470A3B|nr:UDP-glycosyltransferase UGT5-like [Homarus americanus]
MKVLALCVLVLTLAGCVAEALPPPERSYNILMLLPLSTKSHRNVFLTLAEALAERGHQIVMLTNNTESCKHPNIREFNHGIPGPSFDKSDLMNKLKGSSKTAEFLKEYEIVMARKLYKVPSVRDIYRRRKEFDLIVLHHRYNQMIYPFVHEVPFIMVSTRDIDPLFSAVLGNFLHPIYLANAMFERHFLIPSWGLLMDMIAQVGYSYMHRNWVTVPAIQKEISAQFSDLPPLLDLEKNTSLVLLNTQFSMDKALPLLPSQVEVGAMHCRPGKPLPQDLESWINGAGSAGVIYFSLGSVMDSKSLPLEYQQIFLQVFRRLPQRVIWKFEGELKDVPDNVMISKWLPQQDVLAHDNVKVFITHCGLLSLQETIYHAKPLLALPLFSDQPKNALRARDSGLGHSLQWEELTTEVILDALTDILNNVTVQQ